MADSPPVDGCSLTIEAGPLDVAVLHPEPRRRVALHVDQEPGLRCVLRAATAAVRVRAHVVDGDVDLAAELVAHAQRLQPVVATVALVHRGDVVLHHPLLALLPVDVLEVPGPLAAVELLALL